MINFFGKNRRHGRKLSWVLMTALNCFLFDGTAYAGTAKVPHYKKQTTVDFEGALVEGKSRKPYSAYLTQQKDSAFSNLNQWQPDLSKSLEDSKERLDKSQ